MIVDSMKGAQDMHKSIICIVGMLFLALMPTFVLSLLPATPTAGSYPQEALGLPAPRGYDNPNIDTVEDLLPAARAVVTRKERSVQWPGLGIKGGEKVLMVVDARTDPLVIEAFVRALREKKCRVDLLTKDSIAYRQVEDYLKAFNDRLIRGAPNWLEEARKDYDIIFGEMFINKELMIDSYWGYRLEYTNREKLGSPAVTYPDEILDLIETKVWDVIKKAREVRITDPQGTDVSFTWHDEWWQIIEGTHPTIKIPGISRNHIYKPGASTVPMISGHIDVHPRSGMIEKADFSGVAAGTICDVAPVPLIKVYYKNNRIIKIEGGGDFGRIWQKLLDETKSIRYPYYPDPGTAYMCEISLGTHPKYRGPIKDSGLERARRSAGWSWQDARMRSGVLHIAHGTYDAIPWGNITGNPVNHFHIYLFFPTYTVKTKDGKTINLVENGRLKALEDPEVRKVAAKYGDPDELLSEDWIPIFNPATKELEPPPARSSTAN